MSKSHSLDALDQILPDDAPMLDEPLPEEPGGNDTRDLIRSMIVADAETAGASEPEAQTTTEENEGSQDSDPSHDLDLIRSLVAGNDEDEIEESVISPEDDTPILTAESDELERQDAVPASEVSSSFPGFLRRSAPAPTLNEDAHEFLGDGVEDLMPQADTKKTRAEARAAAKSARAAEKMAKAAAKAEAKAARVAKSKALAEAKAEAIANRTAKKQEKIQAAADARDARATKKQAKADAKAEAIAARNAARQAKRDAKAEAEAAKAAARQAKTDAKAEAIAAKTAARQAKADAKAETIAAKAAAKQSKADVRVDKASEKQTEAVLRAIEETALENIDGSEKSEVTDAKGASAGSDIAPPLARRTKSTRSPGKPLRERAVAFRSTVAGIYMRLPERPTRQQSLRATAIFVLLVQPWLVPLVSLIALVSLTFAYFAMGPDKAAEVTGASYRWLEKRAPDKAEKVRQFAQSYSERLTALVARLPKRLSNGIYIPDFSKDDGKTEEVLEDRFSRLAQEARGI